MRNLSVLLIVAGCEEVPPCGELGEAECSEQAECMWSDVTEYRVDGCEVVATSAACFDRVMISAGCAGGACDSPRAAAWYRTEAETGVSLADVDRCGDGIEGWNECQSDGEAFQPAGCNCACE